MNFYDFSSFELPKVIFLSINKYKIKKIKRFASSIINLVFLKFKLNLNRFRMEYKFCSDYAIKANRDNSKQPSGVWHQPSHRLTFVSSS